jgi:hypothetical protein
MWDGFKIPIAQVITRRRATFGIMNPRRTTKFHAARAKEHYPK